MSEIHTARILAFSKVPVVGAPATCQVAVDVKLDFGTWDEDLGFRLGPRN